MTKIHAICTGKVQVRRAQMERRSNGLARITDMLFDAEWSSWLPIYAWVIEHDEGLMLVDTGETSLVHTHGYHPSWHPFYRRAARFSVHPEEEIGVQLRAMGISPRDVRTVILTHLHTDHAGGLIHLTGSNFLVSKTEWEAATGWGGKLQGYLPHRWPRWWHPDFVRFEDRPVGPFQRSMTITEHGDVHIIATPGHTPGHISVIVDGDPTVFLAGDVSYSEELLMAEKVDGVSPHAKIAHETIKRILSFARERPLVYLPSHDGEAKTRLEQKATMMLR